MQGERRPFPGQRLRGSRLLSIPLAFREQGEKVYTTMLLPPAGKRQQQVFNGGRRRFHKNRPPTHHRPIQQPEILIDTGSDLCVSPRRLVPGQRKRTSYDLFAANDTPIPTYGWHTLMLNLGLRRDITWISWWPTCNSQSSDGYANFNLFVD